MAGSGTPPSCLLTSAAQLSLTVVAPLRFSNTLLGLKAPWDIDCSIPVSAVWKALARYCSLPAMMNSRLAEFMPDTASNVSTSSRIRPMTSAAPCCCRFNPVVDRLRMISGSQRVAHLDGAGNQQMTHMPRAGGRSVGVQ